MPSCCCTEIGLMSAPGLPGDRALCFGSLFTPLPPNPDISLAPTFFILSLLFSFFFVKSHVNKLWQLLREALAVHTICKLNVTRLYFTVSLVLFACSGLLMSSGDSWWMEHSGATMCLPKVIQSHCDYNNPEIIAVWCNAAFSPPFLSSLCFTIQKLLHKFTTEDV